MSHLCPKCVREWRQCRCPHDELTVDDVLGALQPRIDHVHLGGQWHLERDWRTTETGDAWRLLSDEDPSACWSGTMREMWALAKRRGLLG